MSTEQRQKNEMLFYAAIELIPIANDGVDVPKWFAAFVQQAVNNASAAIAEEHPESPLRTNWEKLGSLRDQRIVTAATEMHREGRVDVSLELIATALMYPYVRNSGTDWPMLFKTVSEAFDGGADQLRKRISSRIEKILAGNYSDEPNIGGLGGGGLGGLGNLRAPQFLQHQQEFWKAAFALLGDDTTTTKESLDVLSKFNTATVGDSRIIPEEIQPALDAAIAKLSAK